MGWDSCGCWTGAPGVTMLGAGPDVPLALAGAGAALLSLETRLDGDVNPASGGLDAIKDESRPPPPGGGGGGGAGILGACVPDSVWAEPLEAPDWVNITELVEAPDSEEVPDRVNACAPVEVPSGSD